MSVYSCLQKALDDGDIDQDEHDALSKLWDQYKAGAQGQGKSEADAEAEADWAVMDALDKERARQRWHKNLERQITRDMMGEMEAFRNGSGQRDVGEYLMAKMSYNGQGSNLKSALDNQRQAIQGRAKGMASEALWEFRAGIFGRRVNQAKQKNWVAEMFGEDTKDPAAKSLAGAASKTIEYLRQRFNRAGGDIGKRENYGLPTKHDTPTIRRFIEKNGRDAFKARLMQDLDWSKMYDHKTGRAGIDPEAGALMLDGIIDDMLTEGWVYREPGFAPLGKGKLANQRREHRFFVFKDAQTWLNYQRDFGKGDPLRAFVDHIDSMARDIAALEVLGPNPDARIAWLGQVAEKEAAMIQVGEAARLPKRLSKKKYPKGAEQYVKEKSARMRDMWDTYTGKAYVPRNQTIADTGAVIRNILTAARLDEAVITALSDVVIGMAARNGNAGSHTRYIRQVMSELGSIGSDRRKKKALQMGLMIEAGSNVLYEGARFGGSFLGPEWSAHIANQSLEINMLSPWTRMQRRMNQMGLMGDIGDFVDLPFGKLPADGQRTLTKWGFDPTDWDAIRKAGTDEDGFLTPERIDQVDARLADRYMSMILGESERAVPSGTLRSQSLMEAPSERGTLVGEAIQSAKMFLSFTVTLSQTHIYEMLQKALQQRGASLANHAAWVLIGGTVFGALTLQLREMTKGRDPRNMEDEQFWKEAILRGGGLGIYGDFLFADVNRYGAGLEQTVAGPVVQTIDDVRNLTIGNVNEVVSGEDSNAAAEFARFGGSFVPTGPFLAAAYERNVLDQLTLWLDPEGEDKLRRIERARERDYGQEYWWGRGDRLPERAPDLDAALPD